MAFKGDPLFKRMIQASLKPLGYKIVQAKAYDARQRAAPDASRPFNKLFCIGFNKTGTTSVERVLLDWGLRIPKQLEQEAILCDVIPQGDFSALRAFCADFDAFQDLPFSQSSTYVACDALFPGSRFVLTTRHPERWVESYIRFYKREFGLGTVEDFSEEVFRDKALYLKRGYVHSQLQRLLVEHVAGQPVLRWDLAFDRDFLMALYTRRNSEIRAHFAQRPNALLEIELSTEPDTSRLMHFLGITGQQVNAFPTENARNA